MTKTPDKEIEQEAEERFPDGGNFALLRRQGYIAGRSKGLEREKKLEQSNDGLKADLERCKKVSSEMIELLHKRADRLIKDLDGIFIGGLANQSVRELKELLPK